MPATAPPLAKPPPALELNSEDLEEEELASIKRVPALTLRLWENLLKPRGFEITGGSLVRSPSKAVSRANQDGDVSPLAPKSRLPDDNDTGGSVIASFKRVNSFVQPAPVPVPRQPFRRATSGIALESPLPPPSPSGTQSAPIDMGHNVAGPSSQGSSGSRYLFAGLKFRGLGEARSPVVRNEIESCGGRMVSDDEPEENVDFVLVRLVR